jgi:uncharacterized protein YndB with AHSA1/START domain
MKITKGSVKREIVVNAPLNNVWKALTIPEHLNRWYTKNAEIDFRIGGKGFMEHGWGSTTEGIFTEIKPMKHFVLQSLDGDFTTITTLKEVEKGIKVSIEYQASFISDMNPASKENMLFGTMQFLENLKSVYETGIDKREKFWRTWIGIVHTTDEENKGTKVLQVNDGTVAATAGIKPDDVIVGIDADKIDGYESFERKLNTRNINSLVVLTIERESEVLRKDCIVDQYPVPY